MSESDVADRYNVAAKEYASANIMFDMNKGDEGLRTKRDTARLNLFQLLAEDGAPETIAAARKEALEGFIKLRDRLREEIEADQQDEK